MENLYLKQKISCLFLLCLAVISIANSGTITNPVIQEYQLQDPFKMTEIPSATKISSEGVVNGGLGWIINETRSIYVTYRGYQNVVCTAIFENVVILVEAVYSNNWPFDTSLQLAKKFQYEVYEPTAQLLGVPRTSFDSSNDFALVLADISGFAAGVYDSSNLANNGFESVTVDKSSVTWSIVVHEYQHCVHEHYRSATEERWFNEGLSECWAAVLKVRMNNRTNLLGSYEGFPNTPLLYWDYDSIYISAVQNYGAGFAFVWYIYEHYGMSFLKVVLNDSNKTIIDSMNYYLPIYGYSDTFDQIFTNWILAMYVKDPAMNNKLWSYTGLYINMAYENGRYAPSQSKLPTNYTGRLFHRASLAYTVSIRSPTFSHIKYTFDGENTGNFKVFMIANEYFNLSYTKKHVYEMTIDAPTQDGSGLLPMQPRTTSAEIIVINMNGDEALFIAQNMPLESLRNSFMISIETFGVASQNSSIQNNTNQVSPGFSVLLTILSCGIGTKLRNKRKQYSREFQ